MLTYNSISIKPSGGIRGYKLNGTLNNAALYGFTGVAGSGWGKTQNFDVNVVDNYDFSQGTSGWTLFGTAPIVSNKTYTFTTRQNQNDSFIRFLGLEISTVYFVFCIIKPNTKNTITKVGIRFTGGSILKETVAGEYVESFIKGVTNTSGLQYLDCIALHGNSVVTDTVTVEGDPAKGGGVFAINLTKLDAFFGTSYASMTAEQINAIKYDLLLLEKQVDALSFDGIDDHCRLANTPDVDLTTAPITWANTIRVTTNHTGFVQARNIDTAANVQYGTLHREGRSISAYIGGADRLQFSIDSNWVHVMFEWTGTEIIGYKNGALAASTPFTGPLPIGLFNRIGARSGAVDGTAQQVYFKGDIASNTIYNKPASEVMAIEKKIAEKYVGTWG